MTTTKSAYCDSCMEAANNEAGYELDPFSIAMLLVDLGADIADHLCDKTESGETCACACNRRRY